MDVPDTVDRMGRFTQDLPNVPDRSLQQRMSALDNANAVRTYRAVLKKDLKAGYVNVVHLLTDPPGKIETMKIFDLLMCVPKLGRTKVNKLLIHCRVSPSKTVGGLSSRQRDEIVVLMQRL